MERTTFLGHYRISTNHDQAPRELSRAGAAITYKAKDTRSGEPVSLKLIPITSIDPETLEQFEEQARAAQHLHHINIAKVLDFGKEAEHFVYVSEHLEGETLDSWIAEHGPMPPDAVLRIAAQVVSALSAASFHRLVYRSITPSNLLIVPGPTADGGWPLVKLMDFGSSGPKPDSHGGATPEKDFSNTRQFASPEQLQHGTVDFRSEIYSLGATMYFLLTGIAPRPKMRLQHLRQFPKALRNLLTHMLRANPDRRPQDPVALAEAIRECLVKIERRQAFARRLGIPPAAIIPGKWRMPSTPLAQVMGGIIVVTALLVAMGVLATFLLPDDINPFRQRTAERQTIGVPVGVPDASSSPQSQPGNPAPLVANEPATNSEPTIAGANQNGSPTTQQEQTSNSQSIAAATSPSAANANPSPPAQADNSGQEQAALSAQPSVAPQPTAEPESNSVVKKQGTAGSTSKSTRNGQSFLDQRDSESAPTRGRGRARVVGITSDGKLIFRLPSGRTAIVAPDSDEDQIAPRRQRRPRMERGQIFSPPSSGLDDFPND
jgi:serine/threonine protein kinase